MSLLFLLNLNLLLIKYCCRPFELIVLVLVVVVVVFVVVAVVAAGVVCNSTSLSSIAAADDEDVNCLSSKLICLEYLIFSFLASILNNIRSLA